MIAAVRDYVQRIPSFDPAERAFVGRCREAVSDLGDLRDLAEAAGAPARDLETLSRYRETFEAGLAARQRKTLLMSIAEQAGVAGMLGVGGAACLGMAGALSLGTFASVFFPAGALMVAGTLGFYKLRAQRAALPQGEVARLGRQALETVATYRGRSDEMRRQVAARNEVRELHDSFQRPVDAGIVQGVDEVRIGGITLKVRPSQAGFGLEVPEEPPPPRGPLG